MVLQTYKVFFHVKYFWYPQERSKFSHRFGEKESSGVNEIVDMEHIDLRNGFKLPSN